MELAEREAGAKAGAGLRVREGLPLNSPQLKPPVFDLIGVLIGNGLTDPLSQVAPPPLLGRYSPQGLIWLGGRRGCQYSGELKFQQRLCLFGL